MNFIYIFQIVSTFNDTALPFMTAWWDEMPQTMHCRDYNYKVTDNRNDWPLLGFFAFNTLLKLHYPSLVSSVKVSGSILFNLLSPHGWDCLEIGAVLSVHAVPVEVFCLCAYVDYTGKRSSSSPSLLSSGGVQSGFLFVYVFMDSYICC